jgi:hypothetical protein
LSKQSAWEVVAEILSLKEEVRTKTVLFLWKWWTERNKINKGEKGQGVDGIAADVLNLLNDLSKSERKEPIRQTTGNVRWKAPQPGQLKINSDGSFIQDTMQGSWGFTVRDYEDEVVLAGAGRLGSIPDVITAEAVARAQALQAATDHGISRVQVEMDSTILQKALVSPSMDLAACGMLIRDTRDLLNEYFVCSSVISIPRACNGIAHNLAKLTIVLGPG